MGDRTRIRLARPDELELVFELMLEGFASYRKFPDPSSALGETLADVERDAARGGAVLVFEGTKPVGSARFVIDWNTPPRFDVRQALESAQQGKVVLRSPGGTLTFLRMTILPNRRNRGLGAELVRWLEQLAQNLRLDAVRITVRSQQPDNRPYYQRLGYRVTGYGERYGIDDMVTYMQKPLTC